MESAATAGAVAVASTEDVTGFSVVVSIIVIFLLSIEKRKVLGTRRSRKLLCIQLLQADRVEALVQTKFS